MCSTSLDLGASLAGADGGDMTEVAAQQGQQVLAHLCRHVREQAGQPLRQCRRVIVVEPCEVEHLAAGRVQAERVLVGLEAADQRVDGGVALPEDLLHLTTQGLYMRMRRLGVEAKAGTATLTAAAGEMVGEQQEHAPAFADLPQHPGRQHLAQMRPAKVESPAQIAEGLDQADRRAGGIGEVQTAIHALHGRQRGRMHCAVALAGEHRFGRAEVLRVQLRTFQQPVNPLGDGQGVGRIGSDRRALGVDGHCRPPRLCSVPRP
jgi:hypothetical protein